MKNTLTTHISRIFVVLLHFFNDVNVKTLSCYIFSFIKNPPSNPQGPLKESWSNSQNSRLFFLALPCWHGSSRGKAVTTTTHKNSKFIKQTSLDFLLQMIEMHTHAKQFFCWKSLKVESTVFSTIYNLTDIQLFCCLSLMRVPSPAHTILLF